MVVSHGDVNAVLSYQVIDNPVSQHRVPGAFDISHGEYRICRVCRAIFPLLNFFTSDQSLSSIRFSTIRLFNMSHLVLCTNFA